DDVVEPGLEELEEVLAGDALLPGGLLEEVAELALEEAVRVLRLLLLLELERILALLAAAALAVLAGRAGLAFERLGGAEDRLLGAAREFLLGASVAGHRILSCVLGGQTWVAPSRRAQPGLSPGPRQTRRRFGGRQPLWGIGVTSRMVRSSRPEVER